MKLHKSMIIVLIAIVGTLLLAAPAIAATPLSSYEKQVAALVNKQRARFGLPQLRIHSRLVEAARVHSADMPTLAPACSELSQVIRRGAMHRIAI